MTSTEIAQQLLNGAWMHASAALEACRRSSESLPRPTREVPLFSVGFEPRVGVAPELELRILALNVTAPADLDSAE